MGNVNIPIAKHPHSQTGWTVQTTNASDSPLPIIVLARLLVELVSDAWPSLFGFLAEAASPRSASPSLEERGSSCCAWRSSA